MKRLCRYIALLWAEDPVAALCAAWAVTAILFMLVYSLSAVISDLIVYGF